MKMQVTDWKKTVAMYIPDEGLTDKLYMKNFYKLMIARIWKSWAEIAAAHDWGPRQVNWLQIDSHHKNKTESESRPFIISSVQFPTQNLSDQKKKNGQCDRY